MYQPIDLEETGKSLRTMLKEEGYNVKYVQEYLQLACPQSVYRWFKGEALPSVDHLHALSKLLHVHMEELLVEKKNHASQLVYFEDLESLDCIGGRLQIYIRMLPTTLKQN